VTHHQGPVGAECSHYNGRAGHWVPSLNRC